MDRAPANCYFFLATFATGFLAATFFTATFATGFFAADFFTAAFAAGFLAATFFTAAFFTGFVGILSPSLPPDRFKNLPREVTRRL